VSKRLHSEIVATRCSHGQCPIEDCVNFFVTLQRIQLSLFTDLGDSVNNLLCPGRAVVYFPAKNATYSILSPYRAIVLSEPSTTADSNISIGMKTIAAPDARHLWLLVLLPDGIEAPVPNTKTSTSSTAVTPMANQKPMDNGIPTGMTVLRRKDDDIIMKPIGKGATSIPPPPLWQEASSSCKFNNKQRNYVITKVTVADIALVSSLKFKPPNTTTIAAGLAQLLTDLDKATLEMEVADLLKESKAKHLSFEVASKQSGLAAFAQAYALCKLNIYICSFDVCFDCS